jgi:hypothetical protein
MVPQIAETGKFSIAVAGAIVCLSWGITKANCINLPDETVEVRTEFIYEYVM